MPTTRSKSKNNSQQKNVNNKTENLVFLEPVKLELGSETVSEPVCFICWGTSQSTNKIIKMKELILFNSCCDCNSEIHTNCLFDWVNVSKSCPICRVKITVNTQIYNEIDYCYRATILMKIKYNMSIFVNTCYAIVMFFAKHIAILFVLNILIKLSREIIYFIINKT
jgi:hypothetical protein